MQIKTKNVSCHTADFKPVKQEVNGTVILPPLVFPGKILYLILADYRKYIYITLTFVVKVISIFLFVRKEEEKKLEHLVPESFYSLVLFVRKAGAYPSGETFMFIA